MLNRLIRLALVSVFATAVAGYGVAHAQDNPCGDGAANPCGDAAGGDKAAGGDAAGGDAAGGDAAGGDAAGGDAAGGDAAAGGGGDAAGGGEGGGHGMVLPKGKLAVNVGVLVHLSTDAVAKPIAIAPDIRYGLMPKLDVGLYHSPMGINGFWDSFGGALRGQGLCVTGEENGCAKFYNGPVGVLVNYSLGQGKLSLAANGGLLLNSLDPMMLGVKVGINGMYMVSPKLSIMFSPNLIAGLTERDAGNKEAINVPVGVGFAVNPKLHVGLQTGIQGQLDGFADTFFVPVNVGAMFMVNDKLGVAGSFNFFNLLGKDQGIGLNGADFRSLALYLMWHN